MKKLAIIIAVAGLVGTPAFAADMPVKAPPPPPAPVYSWTGWYVGGNLGASFGHVKTDFNVAPVTVMNLTEGVTAATPGFAGSNTEYPSGIIGGGQIGYNWQYSPLIVVGIEADIQGALERGTNNLSNPVSFALVGGPPVAGGTQVTDYTTKIDWFGTVRGRIGYLWGDGAVLTYVTGGLAYGKVDIDGTNTINSPTSSNFTTAFGHSQVNAGWTVGAGTEGKLFIPGWTWKVEYLYVDLGTLDTTTPGVSFTFGTTPPFTWGVTGGGVSTHTHFTDNIVRVGVNYHWGAPVVANY